ncbi:MAG: WD40 repeat domain-containing protein [Acidimicrobiales bacterium]
MIGLVEWEMLLGDYVTALAISPRGDLLAAGSLGGDAAIVTVDGVLVCKLPEHPMGVLCGAWSPDGSRLALGGQDGVVRVHDQTGNEVGTYRGTAWISHVAWSPDGSLLAAADGRHLVLCDSDAVLVQRYPSVSSTITAVAWSANGKRAGVTSYGGITWYDPDHLPAERPSRTHHFKGSPLALVLAPNGKWACAGFQDSSIHLWRLWSGDELSMSGYPAKIEHLAFRDDSQWMASACLDELTVWDFSGRGPKGTRPATGNAHGRHISCLVWEPAGTRLLTGGADGRLALWPSPRSVKQPLTPDDVCDGDVAIATVVWHPAGGSILVGRADGALERRSVTATLEKR